MREQIVIPTVEEIGAMTIEEINAVRATGFCYVKIPKNDDFSLNTIALRKEMMHLFNSETESKKKFTVKKASSKKIDQILISGYTDRRSAFENLETFRQDMNDEVLPPLNCVPDAVGNIKQTLVKRLGIELSKKILSTLNVESEALKILDNALENPVSILTYTYYPPLEPLKRLTAPPGINPHRDIDLLTVIMLEKPGLDVWVDGVWLPLLPKEGYAAVIFGDDFSTLTKGMVRSCLHTVRTTNGEERLSTVCFISTDRSLPYVLTDGTKLANTGTEYLDKRYVHHNLEIKLHAKSAFSYVEKKLNLTYFILYGTFLSRKIIGENAFPISLSNDYKNLSQCLFWGAVGFVFIKISLKLFSMSYFERMILDLLQYSEEPNFATEDKQKAYNLGKKSVSLSGMSSSFFDSSSYMHRSYWNAGFLSALSDQYSDKELVKNQVEEKVARKR